MESADATASAASAREAQLLAELADAHDALARARESSVEVIKYVDREVIREVPVEVIKEVVREVPPALQEASRETVVQRTTTREVREMIIETVQAQSELATVRLALPASLLAAHGEFHTLEEVNAATQQNHDYKCKP